MTESLPIGWFGANASGFENQEQLKEITKYDMVIFGWQAFLSKTNYTREAQQLVQQARKVKAVSPSKPVAIYLDAELAEPFQTAVGRAMSDPRFEVKRGQMSDPPLAAALAAVSLPFL